jgi:hypothetical protein
MDSIRPRGHAKQGTQGVTAKAIDIGLSNCQPKFHAALSSGDQGSANVGTMRELVIGEVHHYSLE